MDAELVQYFVAGLTHYRRAWVIVLVNTVTEAHQLERVVLVLGLGDIGIDVGDITDFVEHVQHRFVGATVCRAPQRGNAGCDTGERVGTRGAGQTHGRGGSVLLVISMENEDAVHGLGQYRADLRFLTRGAKHHVQEVFRVGQIVTRVHERLANSVLVAHRSDGRHFCNKAICSDFTVCRVLDVGRVVIERRQGANHTTHDRHRMRVTAEATVEELQLLVNHGVVFNGADERFFLLSSRQLAEQKQVAHFQIVRLVGQLLDGVAAVQQLPFITVDIGDLRLAGGG